MSCTSRWVLVLSLSVGACATSAADTDAVQDASDGTNEGPGETGGDDVTLVGDDAANGGDDGHAAEDPDCSEATKQVYLVDSNYQFIKFEPKTMSFTSLGALSCPVGGTPNSMAVDRDGFAWVNYSNGELFHVDVETLECEVSNYTPNQQGFGTLGMGFVSDAAGSSEETLYVTNSGRVGKIDTQSLRLTPIGTTAGQPEFTGTGLAELWAFAPPGQGTTSGVIQRLKKGDGSVAQEFPLDLPAADPFTGGTAWAFAFWGGRFYVFYQGPSDTTDVYIFSPETGEAALWGNLPQYRIVGAGVSTCAPTEPPK